jgi:hypothetical protein
MYTIEANKVNGTIKISDSYPLETAPEFNDIGNEYVMSFIDLESVEKFKKFDYNSYGSNNSRYLETYYRVSRDSNAWTEWLSLESEINNFPPFDPKDKMYIDIKWVRSGTSNIGTIKLTDYILEGYLERNISSGTSVLSPSNNSAIIKPPYIYKVFNIEDLEILSNGDIDNTSFKYRFSQDYGRTVTQWEPLTKENITTVKINPIRFFQIEYLIEYNGSSSVTINDINLIGDFQNVTLDGQKTNLHGIRENCNCLKLSFVSDTSTLTQDQINNLSNLGNSTMLTSSTCNNNNAPLTQEEIANLYKPYQQTQAVELLNKLSNDANQMFGHEVVYFITDPDKKGIDYTFHEYQLYNYVCSDLIKISVDGNNFPDNQIVMNQFDLSLFDSFEVHIPKDTFKQIFGVEKRPSKEDFLWFCELNRMFQVEHAQQFRSFNNSSLYWKVMLKKYVQKSNIIGVNQTITDKVKELTKNSTIDELFGIDNKLDKKDVANQEQFKPLTQDVLRQEINVDINKELIENSTTIISKTNYDLTMVDFGQPAVIYRNFRKYFTVSDNFSYFSWFNINNYTVNDVYNLIQYYDDVNSIGFKINIEADNVVITLNQDIYRFEIGVSGNADALIEETWYSYIVNFDQRQRKLHQWLYKRNVDVEEDANTLNSTVLKLVKYQVNDMTPVEFEIENGDMSILGSDMKMTNIRLFNDVIPESEHNKLLNQYIIGEDYRNLIFADNANTRMILPNYSFSQINPNYIRTEINKEPL